MEISWSKLADEIRQKIKSYTQLVDGWHVCKKSVSINEDCMGYKHFKQYAVM